jgi:hypothetical protein
MLGGINNSLFSQGFLGFIELAILVLFLRWAFPTKKDPAAKQQRKELKKSLRALRRK